MRSKEEAHDYRYFPEPDLPPLEVDSAWVEEIRKSLAELPEARRRRFVTQYALPEYDAGVLTQSPALADFFEKTAALVDSPKSASNWVMGELTRKMNEVGITPEALSLTPASLAGLIRLVDSGTISGPIAKDVFEKMYASGRAADEIVATEGLARIDDAGAIEAHIGEVLRANQKAVAQYREGKQQTFGFLVGQVIKATGGKANPTLVKDLLKKTLDQS
jgi:aspartyl-tRNA(Asn)/glutamyl-tRNA(Gln) amidotransferase subunit B